MSFHFIRVFPLSIRKPCLLRCWFCAGLALLYAALLEAAPGSVHSAVKDRDAPRGDVRASLLQREGPKAATGDLRMSGPDLAQLQEYWASASWIVFLLFTLLIAGSCQIAHNRLLARRKQGLPLPKGAELFLHVAYTYTHDRASTRQISEGQLSFLALR